MIISPTEACLIHGDPPIESVPRDERVPCAECQIKRGGFARILFPVDPEAALSGDDGYVLVDEFRARRVNYAVLDQALDHRVVTRGECWAWERTRHEV